MDWHGREKKKSQSKTQGALKSKRKVHQGKEQEGEKKTTQPSPQAVRNLGAVLKTLGFSFSPLEFAI